MLSAPQLLIHIMLSEADASRLKRYGLDTMRDVSNIVSESIFCSAYGIFFALAVYSICRKGLRSRREIIMLVVVVYLYAASVTQYAVDCWTTFRNIYSLFMTTDVPLPDRADLGDADFAKFAGLMEVLFDFNMIIADAVVIWRIWAVYQGQFRAIVIPCVLLLGAFVFAIIDNTCGISEGPLPGGEIICPHSAIVVWAFSVATNILCTALIGFKAWQHRKMMKELSVGGRYHGMSSENVIQIIEYIDIEYFTSLYWFAQILAGLGRQITGMYPTLIIVIVNFQRTIWEQSPSVTLGSSTANKSLQWAVNNSRSGATTVDTGLDVGIQLETLSDVLREDSGHIKNSAASEEI
ncbi:hypothetical protein MSAN_00959800 [Mycena sanguinolenta]|uniref:Uncharacterized protein n=1 Tax=Mycena sanguinolenta TaxID=230812 RepID=A0A8H6YXG3_9AGAR|nr:hypothetical protein MSAN_00959800 [Mycena sanguinolenta]